MTAKTKRPELTVMSGIAIVFVLCIHASGSALADLYPDAAGYAETDYFLRLFANLVSPAVPMFLFVSGYKYALHDRNTPYLAFLKKRLPRVLMSFFIINTLFWALDSIIWMERFDPFLLMKTYISSWMGNTVAYPLWYIPMYCFVIIICPLLNRVIRNNGVRFLLLLAIGLLQRYFSAIIPAFGERPIMFISYPVFFEMGNIACEKNWGTQMRHKRAFIVAYVGILAVVSYKFPILSLNAKYAIYYIAGTWTCYLLSLEQKENKLLRYLGDASYPLFLLHEPIIGRLVGNKLVQLRVGSSLSYCIMWVVIVLTLTLIVVEILKRTRVHNLLWNYQPFGK